MCSTPQKQPAAMVAVCAPAGTFIGVAGAELMENGRMKRERNDIERKAKMARASNWRSIRWVNFPWSIVSHNTLPRNSSRKRKIRSHRKLEQTLTSWPSTNRSYTRIYSLRPRRIHRYGTQTPSHAAAHPPLGTACYCTRRRSAAKPKFKKSIATVQLQVALKPEFQNVQIHCLTSKIDIWSSMCPNQVVQKPMNSLLRVVSRKMGSKI